MSRLQSDTVDNIHGHSDPTDVDASRGNYNLHPEEAYTMGKLINKEAAQSVRSIPGGSAPSVKSPVEKKLVRKLDLVLMPALSTHNL